MCCALTTHTSLLAGLQAGCNSGAARSEWQRRLPQRHWDVLPLLLWGVPADAGIAAEVGQRCREDSLLFASVLL